MISRRKRKSESERLLEQGAREAPEPKTAEQSGSQTAGRDALIAGTGAFVLVASLHLLAHLTWWAAIALALISLALNFRYLRSLPRGRRPKTSPLRGLFLFWLAISVPVTVLVAIGGYRSDLIVVVVVWAILVVLWLADRGLARLLQAR